MMAAPKIVDLKPKAGGFDPESPFIALVIEKAENGYIMKNMAPAPGEEDSVIEQTFVFLDRSELLREVARRIP